MKKGKGQSGAAADAPISPPADALLLSFLDGFGEGFSRVLLCACSAERACSLFSARNEAMGRLMNSGDYRLPISPGMLAVKINARARIGKGGVELLMPPTQTPVFERKTTKRHA